MRRKIDIDILKEIRYGKKGYNIVRWDYIGGNFYPHSGWINHTSLSKMYPKSRFNHRHITKPNGYFGIPYNTKTKKFEYQKW